jgi:hypothetical protein
LVVPTVLPVIVVNGYAATFERPRYPMRLTEYGTLFGQTPSCGRNCRDKNLQMGLRPLVLEDDGIDAVGLQNLTRGTKNLGVDNVV